MVPPRGLPRASPGISLAVDRSYSAVRHLPRKGLRRYLKRDQLAGLPETRRKLMRKEQGIVSPFGSKYLYRLSSAAPRQTQLGDVPPPELESIGACLADQELKQFKPCHTIRSNEKKCSNPTGCCDCRGYSLRLTLCRPYQSTCAGNLSLEKMIPISRNIKVIGALLLAVVLSLPSYAQQFDPAAHTD